MWRSENSSQEWLLFCHSVGPGDQTCVDMLAPIEHLASQLIVGNGHAYVGFLCLSFCQYFQITWPGQLVICGP